MGDTPTVPFMQAIAKRWKCPLIQTRSLGVQMRSSQASEGPNEVLVVLGGSRTATLLDGLSARRT